MKKTSHRLCLLPAPREVRMGAGVYEVPGRPVLHLPEDLVRGEVFMPVAQRLAEAFDARGLELEVCTGPAQHPRLAIRAIRDESGPDHPEGYLLAITKTGIRLHFRADAGLRAGVATLRQLLRQFEFSKGADASARRPYLPCLEIRDYPDFERRGVMLDVSRGRVPNLETLLGLVDHLADFKINEFQLYLEHTFAYRNYEAVWRDWGALTGDDILQLDARCRQLGIDLVPNQNSFGHLRYWVEHPPLRHLAEITEPYEGPGGAYLRYPTTLAPGHPGTLPFIRELYDELLPHFTSAYFNVGLDETWDLGRGQSRALCERRGTGRVYLDFLRKIHRELGRRRRRLMFWGDIVLSHPGLVKDVPKNAIALDWGYEADHPFDREAGVFARSGLPFYVCPGTSSWMSLVGRHDNGLANMRSAAAAGLKHGATGYLNTDWGDGGHPQPLAVSYLPYLAGAALSWCQSSYDERLLVPVLNRDIFRDPSGDLGRAAMDLGLAHRKLNYYAMNVTPLGAVIAAPPPELRELVCRDGLKYYARIPEGRIREALQEVEHQRGVLYRSRPAGDDGEMLAVELDMAARMAGHSCKIMLWQQALAANHRAAAGMARSGIRELREIQHDFEAYWPLRNKGTTAKCSAFLQWRIDDYRKARLHFKPDVARIVQKRS